MAEAIEVSTRKFWCTEPSIFKWGGGQVLKTVWKGSVFLISHKNDNFEKNVKDGAKQNDDQTLTEKH